MPGGGKPRPYNHQPPKVTILTGAIAAVQTHHDGLSA